MSLDKAKAAGAEKRRTEYYMGGVPRESGFQAEIGDTKQAGIFNKQAADYTAKALEMSREVRNEEPASYTSRVDSSRDVPGGRLRRLRKATRRNRPVQRHLGEDRQAENATPKGRRFALPRNLRSPRRNSTASATKRPRIGMML
jgi:hypothetical protein